MPRTTGWISERTGTAITFSGPNNDDPSTGWASLRKTDMRRATVSARGESRSCGRVSQSAIEPISPGSPPYHDRTDSTISCASRFEGTTITTGLPDPLSLPVLLPPAESAPGAGIPSAAAAASAGRIPAGAPTRENPDPSSASWAKAVSRKRAGISGARVPLRTGAPPGAAPAASLSSAIELLLGLLNTLENYHFRSIGSIRYKTVKLLFL